LYARWQAKQGLHLGAVASHTLSMFADDVLTVLKSDEQYHIDNAKICALKKSDHE